MSGFPEFIAPDAVIVPAIFTSVFFAIDNFSGALTAHRIRILLFRPATVMVELILRLDLMATQTHFFGTLLCHDITSTGYDTTRRVHRAQILPMSETMSRTVSRSSRIHPRHTYRQHGPT